MAEIKKGDTLKTGRGEQVDVLHVGRVDGEDRITGLLHAGDGLELHHWTLSGSFLPGRVSKTDLVLQTLDCRVCFETEVGGLPIKLEQLGVDRFTVTYWKQVKTNLSYATAAEELGSCIMHALACEGVVDNAEPVV